MLMRAKVKTMTNGVELVGQRGREEGCMIEEELLMGVANILASVWLTNKQCAELSEFCINAVGLRTR